MQVRKLTETSLFSAGIFNTLYLCMTSNKNNLTTICFKRLVPVEFSWKHGSREKNLGRPLFLHDGHLGFCFEKNITERMRCLVATHKISPKTEQFKMAVLSEKVRALQRRLSQKMQANNFLTFSLLSFSLSVRAENQNKFTLKTKTTKHLLSYSNLRQTHFKAERDFLEIFNFSPSFLTDLPFYLLMIVLLQLFSLSLH